MAIPKNNNKDAQKANESRTVTMAEVAKHTTKEDFWLAIEGKAYDLTTFLNQHPGGAVIQTHGGLDATDVFYAFHSDAATEILGNYFIADIVDYQPTPVVQGYRELRRELEKLGLFSSSTLYYTYKNLSNFFILFLSMYTVINYGQGMWGVLCASVLMSFFLQQMGWLSHDYLHHQVFEDRFWGHAYGFFLGNVCQGFSHTWWLNKHNTHHAAPNIIEFDSDIDTMPLLAWSDNILKNFAKNHPFSPVATFIIRNQHIFYFPLLFVARLSWATQSILFALYSATGKTKLVEVSTLALHYSWFFALAFGYMSFTHALCFIFMTQSITGFLLGVVFSLGHNGMEVYHNKEMTQTDFATIQIATGRDVNGFFYFGDKFQFFVSWLMGGLHYQVVHHMFPTIPRHNLPAAQQKVLEFARKYKLPYYSTSFAKGTSETVERLISVGRLVTKLKDN